MQSETEERQTCRSEGLRAVEQFISKLKHRLYQHCVLVSERIIWSRTVAVFTCRLLVSTHIELRNFRINVPEILTPLFVVRVMDLRHNKHATSHCAGSRQCIAVSRPVTLFPFSRIPLVPNPPTPPQRHWNIRDGAFHISDADKRPLACALAGHAWQKALQAVQWRPRDETRQIVASRGTQLTKVKCYCSESRLTASPTWFCKAPVRPPAAFKRSLHWHGTCR